jgi:NADH dehydrogenase/NADH:ubiquinone oxidoreductase subunit G
MATRASFPPGEAREDWAILRALSDVLGKRLPYDSLAALRQALYRAHPHVMRIGQIAPANAADIRKLAGLGGAVDKAPFRSTMLNFYFTNPIAALYGVDVAQLQVRIAEGAVWPTLALQGSVQQQTYSNILTPNLVLGTVMLNPFLALPAKP